MSKEIYISTTPHETRLAIVEDDQLAEIYYERENEYTLAGSIYNGKVTRVLPGMQSSFVDIGLERDAFLYVTDFMEEAGDSADFDSADGGAKSRGGNNGGGRERSATEGGGGREGGGRERGGRGRDRDRNRGERTPEPREAVAETESTTSFDEPVAPAPTESVGGGDDEGTGSRRWRGRRGRRRGRTRGETPVESAAPADAESVTLEGGYDETADETVIEIDLTAEAEAPAAAVSRDEHPRRDGRGGRGRDRRGRGGDRDRGGDRPRGGEREKSRPADAPLYDNSYAGYDAPEDHSGAPAGEPIMLPGESIRKYRDPAEVAAEEEEARRNAPPKAEVLTVSAPSIEIVGWDGGAVLPGESLGRHRGRGPKAGNREQGIGNSAPAAAVAAPFDVAPVVAPVVAEVPVAAAEPVAAEPVAAEPVLAPLVEEALAADAGAVVEEAAPESETAAPEVTEYEPTEGASASVNDSANRDLRRFENEPEVKPEISAEAEEAIEESLEEALPELAAEDPIDLEAAAEVAAEETHDATTYDLDASLDANFTTLQPSGEMISETASVEEQGVAPIASQDIYEPAAPIAHEAAVQSVDEAHAETTPVPVASAEEDHVQPEIHAFGDGDFQEEELDEEDDFEFESLSGHGDEEADEYEEETLEDSGDFLHEMHVDEAAEEGDEDASGGFTEADFAGDPEVDEAPAETAGSNEPRRERGGDRGRRSGSGGGRDRRGGRNSGGDRGRGRRQSVQTQDLPAINELLKPGQEILVQIAKEPIAKKGARITSHIALPGRFLVFMPTVNHTGVSRKISSDEERRRLKSILLSEKGDAQGGFIVRTAADGASEEELRTDLRFLIQMWTDIKQRSETSKSPALIYHDLNLVERILRDQVTDNFSAIWVDTEVEYERVLRFLQRFQPSLVRRVKLYTKETPIFEHFGITTEIEKALKSKVWLKSGGSIVINQTEALVAIDINTGKYVGKTARLEDTILKTNLDSIPEIVRQIRLRDLGGIIVIDFIDMDERKNRAKVLQALEDEMRADRAPSKILPFNDFGLVIMTRKRVKQSLERTLCMPDPVTEGTGMIKSPVTVANEIYVEMKKMHRHLEKQDVMLRVHPEVVKTLKLNNAKRLVELEEMTRKTILLKSDPSLSPEAFDIH